MVMRWTDGERSRVNHLSRQIRLNLWVFAALTVLGMVRVGFAWPGHRAPVLAALGAAVLVLAGAQSLRWDSLAGRPWMPRAVVASYSAALAVHFLFCLADPYAQLIFPVGAVMLTAAAATTIGSRAGLGLGAAGLVGYGAMIVLRPGADVVLTTSIASVMLAVAGLCLLTANNRRHHLAERRAAERRTVALMENGSDAVLAVGEGEVRYVSSSIGRILGRDADSLTFADLGEMTHPDDVERINAFLGDLRVAGAGATGSLETRTLHSDGTWIDTEVTGTNHLDDPDIRAVILSVRDVSTQNALRAELLRQAFEDPVTGLPNRALLLDRIVTAVRRHARNGGHVSLLLIDLEDFKKINDTLGHMAGDDFLRTVAQRMTSVVRPSDTLARLGGDEFAVFVEELDELGLHTLAERLLAEIKLPVRLGTSDLIGTASIGIATLKATQDADVETANELMRDADLAMYAAKLGGRDRIAVFDPSMYTAAVMEAEARTELERGLGADEFTVVYQPIVDLPSGLLIGVEALARWQHPTRGLVGPDSFIPQAERTGLIVPLGAHVLRVACHEVAGWHSAIPGAENVRVSINLSARQFQEPDLVDTVRAALADSGIRPHLVVLEITESLLMHDVDATVVTLHELRELGVQIAVDDFGTGYSSLSYLRRFPIDILKIDKAFIDGITDDSDDATLAEAVVGLGKALRLSTVAEGIEHADQQEMLSQLGVTYGQGYLFARPGSADEIAEMVRAAYRKQVGGQ
ncbi:EAL domain-containing protein [Paractinoplanes ferrugineus]|uniref:GGDEF domain-containing protein n=1 Tax=Paractinoplanes ferrugineus TaxID=113564 RepID=A0A919J560_9ACTN|nr:EAL domain-containing protein [Actinoplanes ferrugineus]GIE10791.1 GGDEF domain-containing protein [Actinoplanes ferrugineus]